MTFCFSFYVSSAFAQHTEHGARPAIKKQASAPNRKTQVVLEYKGKLTLKAKPQTVSFVLRDYQKNPIVHDGLETLHEKKIHVLVYDESLTQFFHVHPSEKNGTWTTEPIPFEKSGKYFFWAEGKLNGAEHEFNKLLKLEIEDGKPAISSPKNLSQSLSGTHGNSVVTLKVDSISAKKDVMPMLEFSRSDSSTSQLTPYLGALAHVVIVSLKGDKLIHVHPMLGDKPNELMMHTKFPEKGDYRIWVQFIDGGDLKIVPLAVNVK